MVYLDVNQIPTGGIFNEPAVRCWCRKTPFSCLLLFVSLEISSREIVLRSSWKIKIKKSSFLTVGVENKNLRKFVVS